jgi:hypothetical protein
MEPEGKMLFNDICARFIVPSTQITSVISAFITELSNFIAIQLSSRGWMDPFPDVSHI